jgi:hypothetical protein
MLGVLAGGIAYGQVTVAETASHAVRGVVKSLDASSLVITRPARRVGDLTFVFMPSTLRGGTIAVGSTVSVRYRKEGDTLIAVAVTVHVPRQAAYSPD